MSAVDPEQVKENIRQYIALKEQIDMLVKRQSEIKTRLITTVDEFGEVDGKGHIVFDIDEPETGTSRLMKQRKVSKPLDEEAAYALLEEKGIKDQCVVMVPQLDQDEIMASLYKGILTEADIDVMFPPKISYAFIVTR